MKSLIRVFSLVILTGISLYAGYIDFVKNGAGKYHTLEQKIYEWENYGSGYYCFHAAGATAINIRVGKKVVDEASVEKYFREKMNVSNIHETDLNDWINAGNQYHIEGLNTSTVPRRGYFDTKKELWDSIKENIESDRPMIVAIKSWNPIYRSAGKSLIVDGYSRETGHALTIVGYYYSTRTQTRYIAIRDPSVSHANSEERSNQPLLYDYFISLETLEEYLQIKYWEGTDIPMYDAHNQIQKKRRLMVFNTNKDVDLKTMAISDKDEPGQLLPSARQKYIAKGKQDKYPIEISQNGLLTVRLSGLDHDIDLKILVDDYIIRESLGWGTDDEVIELSVSKGDRYVILVDGFASGHYDLDVSLE